MTGDTWREEDAADRRAALDFAGTLALAAPDTAVSTWQRNADLAYRWLQGRDTLRAATIEIKPGTPRKEGTTVTATINLDDTDELPFSLTGLDEKDVAVPLPTGFTAAWTLNDPDASGAALTVSADTTTAVVAAGVPTANLLLSVAVTEPDGTVLPGAEAIIVQPTAAVTVGLVAGTPVPEPPPGG